MRRTPDRDYFSDNWPHMRLFGALLIGLITLVACSSTTNSWPGNFTYATLPAAGNAAAGQTLVQAGTLNATACGACHAVGSEPPAVGPSLNGIATRAIAGWEGHNAEDYLFRAIVYPRAHVVSGYSSSSSMPSNYGDKLQPQQIRDLITYLLTLQ